MLRRCAFVVTVVLLAFGLIIPSAQAESPGRGHRPNLVVLGDSFAAGTGNPYPTPPSDCRRSDSAYGPLLASFGVVDLQAFVACSGATTVQVSGPGPNGENPQINSITHDTDVVTVQALGNDFFFGTISGLCILADCSPTSLLPPDPANRYPLGTTVGDVLKSIPEKSPALLDDLYNQISYKLGDDSHARVLVVEYGAPFPAPTGRVGPFCPAPPLGYMSTEELGVAQDFTKALNKQLEIAANEHHFRIVKTRNLFRGLDVCGVTPAFFRPPLPGLPGFSPTDPANGALHPNQLGQKLYAAAVGARLF